MLAAATSLSAYPWDESLALRGEARSRSCGSSIMLALAVDSSGNIAGLGIRPNACAVGQAAAHVFAAGAIGKGRADVEQSRTAIAAWLADTGSMPDWPGIDLLEPALPYPARRGAILLAWDAALAALP
jgi:NifU-like protein involved in Fe-S cluster formation